MDCLSSDSMTSAIIRWWLSCWSGPKNALANIRSCDPELIHDLCRLIIVSTVVPRASALGAPLTPEFE